MKTSLPRPIRDELGSFATLLLPQALLPSSHMLCLLFLSCAFMAGVAWPHEVDPDVTEEHRGLREAAKTALWGGNMILFDALLKAGLQIDKPLDLESGDTALHIAVATTKPDTIRYVLKLGANPLSMNHYQNKPVDRLADRDDEKEVQACLEVLKRELTDYDRKKLMGVPIPVWREVLGSPECATDPLAPPSGDEEPLLVSFISINDSDPSPEMKFVLDMHFPGWRPGSVIESAEPPAGSKHPSIIRDKNTKQYGVHVQISLVESSSQDVRLEDRNYLAKFVRSQKLPAYEFKIRRTFGGALNGGGWGGHLVQLNGYWMKFGTHGWDE